MIACCKVLGCFIARPEYRKLVTVSSILLPMSSQIGVGLSSPFGYDHRLDRPSATIDSAHDPPPEFRLISLHPFPRVHPVHLKRNSVLHRSRPGPAHHRF